jgi:deoxyribonuclease-4
MGFIIGVPVIRNVLSNNTTESLFAATKRVYTEFNKFPTLSFPYTTVLMPFILPPRKTIVKNVIDFSLLDDFLSFVKKNNITLVNHGSYITNICRDPNSKNKNFNGLIAYELKIAEQLEMKGSIVHLKTGLPEHVVENTKSILDKSNVTKTKLIFEVPAGRTPLGTTIESLCEVWEAIYDEGISSHCGICIDTAHMWSDGYDISKTEVLVKYLKQFSKKIGIENLSCIHLNGNYNPITIRKDIHAPIGNPDDQIWGNNYETLPIIFTLAKENNIPLIFESHISPHDTMQKEVSIIEECKKSIPITS